MPDGCSGGISEPLEIGCIPINIVNTHKQIDVQETPVQVLLDPPPVIRVNVPEFKYLFKSKEEIAQQEQNDAVDRMLEQEFKNADRVMLETCLSTASAYLGSPTIDTIELEKMRIAKRTECYLRYPQY